jgi:hypothetical protein
VLLGASLAALSAVPAPHSEAVLEERWDRPRPNRLRTRLTLIDPLTNAEPWEASPEMCALITKETMAIGG